jgi:DNA-binding response OmpR family regulator
MPTILIVDDAVLHREAVSRLLEHEGFTVLRANDGRAAWVLMYHHSPDLVLLDLVMPMMDGVTLLRMIRGCHRWHELPVIVLTGATDDHRLIENVRELEIQGLVPKASFNFDDLLSRIKQHLPKAVA